MRSQVSRLCSSAAFSLNKIGQIADYLDRSSLLKFVHSYISSKLDFCNALFLGLPDRELNRVQRIQNSAARLVSRTNINDHITPVLKELHWLPINSRITYKILLFTFKALNGHCPSYLSSLLHPCDARYNIRSVTHNRLKQPKSRLCNYGDQSFSVVAPRLWNSLPNQIRRCTPIPDFKKQLKTYLFTQHFQWMQHM